jgi:hypothetical protein
LYGPNAAPWHPRCKRGGVGWVTNTSGMSLIELRNNISSGSSNGTNTSGNAGSGIDSGGDTDHYNGGN